MLYISSSQFDRPVREIQVRTAGDPSTAAATIYRQLANADSRIAVTGMFLARERVDNSIVAEALTAKLSAVFGLLALALAGVGLYGLIAYVTAQRRAEFGIRIALGAERRDVRRLVLRDTLTLVALGTALGMPAALAGAQLLSSLLYQVKPADPLAIAVSLGALGVLAVVAAYLPARRATAVDPVNTLRAE
jgi:ABC-type antimicrobial peptide transport system permease subunit